MNQTPNISGNTDNNSKPITKTASFFRQFKDVLHSILHLEEGVDKRNTIHEIKNKKSMSGANAWMLMCSIMIASIGLDTNSTAVIIGAMLISPLMSPILGMGLGAAINDWETIRSSLLHFSIAIFIAIVASTLYFYLSPFGEITPEIEARTTPTFLDVFIALFGGIAGIISVARKDISTTIPGVAIATALMPPLCVTGFGLANGEWNIAFSSFYLFFLNTFFVAGSSYLLVRYLRFPYKNYVNAKEKRRNSLISVIISIVIIVPSILIFRQVFEEFQTEVKVNNFIEEYVGEDRLYLDDFQYIPGEDINRLVLKVYGQKINQQSLPTFYEGLKKYELENVAVELIPTSDIKLDRLDQIESKLDGVAQIKDQLQVAKEEQKQKEQMISMMEAQIEAKSLDSLLCSEITKEASLLFPEIEHIYLGNLTALPLSDTLSSETMHILLNVRRSLKKSEKTAIESWFALKIPKGDDLSFYYQ